VTTYGLDDWGMIPAMSGEFLLWYHLQAGYIVHLASYEIGWNSRSMKLTTDIHLVLRCEG